MSVEMACIIAAMVTDYLVGCFWMCLGWHMALFFHQSSRLMLARQHKNQKMFTHLHTIKAKQGTDISASKLV